MKTRKTAAACTPLLTLALLATAACGLPGTDEETPGGSSAGFQGRGPITYVTGEDTTGVVQKQLDRWNKEHPDEPVTFIELPEAVDEQRRLMIQNAKTKSDAYTVLSLDVVWTAEFAANQWIERLPAEEFPLEEMLEPVVETARHKDGLYGVPLISDGGILFYRTDLLQAAGISEPPTTWADMRNICDAVLALPQAKGMSCYAGQFDQYEGLTVNFSEAVASAGGIVVDHQGQPHVDTPEAREGLDFLVGLFRDGLVPEGALTYTEEDGRQAFQQGKLVFIRQWPYLYAAANATDGSSKVAGKFDVTTLPGLTRTGSSSLGGRNLALSSYAKNQATAIDFIKFITNEDNARKNLKIGSNAPVYETLYDEPSAFTSHPYLPVLRESIIYAMPRPHVAEYGKVTSAIQKEVHAALRGDKTSEQALADLQQALRSHTKRQP
ncbi:ABC transporter substrate-binding protein [Streptomyces sp. S1A]|uniref:ABC transporter substrate-binding protein n=1 Tax=Streptomyces sp. ICN903 TaxID=2964654 RepID=UPI001EDA2720|nr:ABC transporter substrate-binding protein [Streptomyces sp. ICN903]MCG3044484.1 ABC transporter substrate-binding protein [Streptomyces sp. ICN903]